MNELASRIGTFSDAAFHSIQLSQKQCPTISGGIFMYIPFLNKKKSIQYSSCWNPIVVARSRNIPYHSPVKESGSEISVSQRLDTNRNRDRQAAAFLKASRKSFISTMSQFE